MENNRCSHCQQLGGHRHDCPENVSQEGSDSSDRWNRKRFALVWLGWLALCSTVAYLLHEEIWAPSFWATSSLIVVEWGALLFIAGLRFHDCDRSGYWSILLLVPGFNVVAFFYLLIAPGTKGDNRFGSDPLAQHSKIRISPPPIPPQ